MKAGMSWALATSEKKEPYVPGGAVFASLQRTATGKVQRFVLRDLVRMGTRVGSIES